MVINPNLFIRKYIVYSEDCAWETLTIAHHSDRGGQVFDPADPWPLADWSDSLFWVEGWNDIEVCVTQLLFHALYL